MRPVALATVVLLAACAPEPAAKKADSTAPAISAIPTLPKVATLETDSGPPVQLDRTATGFQLRLVPKPGEQINALQPPVLQTSDGRRLEFRGPAVTKDSAYYVGDVIASLAPDALPIEGTLITSYCRANEKLCRTAKRVVRFAD